jgi:hypothetical protein
MNLKTSHTALMNTVMETSGNEEKKILIFVKPEKFLKPLPTLQPSILPRFPIKEVCPEQIKSHEAHVFLMTL